MNSLKRVVAITLCFCLIVLSASSVSVDAKYNHKSFVEKVDQYLKNKEYTLRDKNTYKGVYDRLYEIEGNGYKNVGLILCKSKKSTKKSFKKIIKLLAKNFNNYSYLVFKRPNKNTIYLEGNDGRWYGVLVFKMNTKKCRIVVGSREYVVYRNHAPKKKTIKKTKKWAKKMVNKINSF